jgi:hypothetical protein
VTVHEESVGPLIWSITDGKLGSEEQANMEKAVEIATGAGHTTPIGDEADSSLECLVSPVGQAVGGGFTDSSSIDDSPGGMPTREDIERMIKGGACAALYAVSNVPEV